MATTLHLIKSWRHSETMFHSIVKLRVFKAIFKPLSKCKLWRDCTVWRVIKFNMGVPSSHTEVISPYNVEFTREDTFRIKHTTLNRRYIWDITQGMNCIVWISKIAIAKARVFVENSDPFVINGVLAAYYYHRKDLCKTMYIVS